MIDKKIGIIGCGNMGEAIFAKLAGVLEKSTKLIVSELDAKRRDYLMAKYKIIIENDNNYLAKYSDIIIIAVKPKDIEGALNELVPSMSKDKLLISIAAGITTNFIEDLVKEKVPVIRAMPNMPAVVGQAVTSLSRGKYAKDSHLEMAKEIFSLVGETVEVDESLVDAVTAISGSGPAYFFYFIETLVDAAKRIGLDHETAEKLVLKTMAGSHELLRGLKEEPSVLRLKVTSKGGTTEAAIKVFDDKKFKNIIELAVKAAVKKAKELSKRKAR